MIYELIILKRADYYDERAIEWFNSYIVNGNEIHYEMASHYSTKCDGLLEAYAILTGRKIKARDIKNELKRF